MKKGEKQEVERLTATEILKRKQEREQSIEPEAETGFPLLNINPRGDVFHENVIAEGREKNLHAICSRVIEPFPKLREMDFTELKKRIEEPRERFNSQMAESTEMYLLKSPPLTPEQTRIYDEAMQRANNHQLQQEKITPGAQLEIYGFEEKQYIDVSQAVINAFTNGAGFIQLTFEDGEIKATTLEDQKVKITLDQVSDAHIESVMQEIRDLNKTKK